MSRDRDRDRTAGRGAAPASRAQRVFYSLIALLALMGLADSCYLTVMHLTDADVACGPGGGCSTVLSSVYAAVGGIPTAAFGALAYFTTFSLATLAAFSYGWAAKSVRLIVGAMFLVSLGLVGLQAFVLHAFCPFCLLSAAIAFCMTGLIIVAPLAA